MAGAGDVFGRRGNPQLKQLWRLRGLLERLSVALIVLLICCISLFTTFKSTTNRPGIHSGDLLVETATEQDGSVSNITVQPTVFQALTLAVRKASQSICS
ncbi:hypothetical protein C5167_039774 [Papaver somniferum]|uniref:Uncharacterized protein n=1 Tax=Papaver somniferum TaxID=3469 RepID=A0A4Y7ID96_PAPSO|nr:hypothetical protein C5167_039774 [Papaver somniferum]